MRVVAHQGGVKGAEIPEDFDALRAKFRARRRKELEAVVGGRRITLRRLQKPDRPILHAGEFLLTGEGQIGGQSLARQKRNRGQRHGAHPRRHRFARRRQFPTARW